MFQMLMVKTQQDLKKMYDDTFNYLEKCGLGII